MQGLLSLVTLFPGSVREHEHMCVEEAEGVLCVRCELCIFCTCEQMVTPTEEENVCVWGFVCVIIITFSLF